MKKQLHSIKLLNYLFCSILMLLLGTNLSWGQNSELFNSSTPGVTTWTCPAGVTSVQVEAWGGGGGSGGVGGSTNMYIGGGGAGGNYVRKTSVTVVPNTTYNVVVGAGGIGGLTSTTTSNGSGGGMSLLISPDLNSTPLIAALGGVGGGGGATTPKTGPGGVNLIANQQLTYTITNGGSGYTVAPTVNLSKPAGLAPSTTYAVGNRVSLGTAIWRCTTAGTTLSTDPATVGNNVASGTGANGTASFTYVGIAATATAVLTGDVVTAIIINQGSGYDTTTVPTVTFTNAVSDTTGSGAAVTLSAVTLPAVTTGIFSFIGGNGGAGLYATKNPANNSGAGGNSAGIAANGNNSTSGANSAVGASVTGNGLGGASVTGVSYTAVPESAVGRTGNPGSVPGGGGGGPVGPNFSGSLGGAGKVVITLLDTTAPSAVTSASISNPLIQSLQVNWVASQSSPDVTGYVVVAYPANINPTTASLVTGTTYVQGATFSGGTILYVGPATTATNTGLSVDNTYYYKVFAYDANLNYSAEVETSGTTIDATDNTPPGNPGTATISNQTLTTMTTSWLPAASIDGGGYMVVRYSGDPSLETGADPVQKTTYLVNDIIATGTPPVTDPVTLPKNGKVVYVGTDLSYVSTGLTAADTSHFKIYTFDQDHNYSGSSFVSGKTATQIATPVALASSLPTATGFTANWEVAPVVGSYTINVYSAAASASTVVGWTIPAGVADATSLTADVTTANNTTKTLTQNGGATIVTQAISSTTGLLSSISGNPGVAARGATYYSTAIVSGTEGVDAVYATPKATADRYWQINANTVGYKNVTISSNQYSTDSGPRDWKLQYSSDGGSTFSDLGTTLTLSIAAWDSSVSNIALPSVCENNPNVVLRWLQTSFTNTSGVEMTTPSTGGTSRIDNILVKGTKLTLEKSSNEGNNFATSKAITGIDAGSYYYDVVVAKDDVIGTTGIVSKFISSANSNLVQAFTLTPLTAPVATATSNPTESGFTANWGAVAGATDYLFYLYTAPTQSNIAAWTFPVSGTTLTADADKTNANNLTKEISNATANYADNSGLTTRASRGSTYYGTGSPTQYWQVEVNTKGYENVNLSSVQYSTADGPKDFKLQYKIGVDGTYADVPGGTIVVGSANWTSGVVSNLVLPAECNNQSSVFIRWTQTTFTNVAEIEMVTTSGTNRIDDIYIKGAAYSLQANYPITVSGTSTVLDGLTQGNYYYRVEANGDAVTSAKSVKSNAIGGIVYASAAEAAFRSTASGNITSTGIWQFYNGAEWLTTASAPSGTNNNITISAGHTIALEADFTVGTGKTLTVAGTINVAGHVVSGAGSFVLNSAATLKLGNNVSIAAAITTTNSTLSTGANYFFDGTSVAQHTGGLPGSTLAISSANGSTNYTTTLTGNITVSNPEGVTMNQAIRLNTPGILTVTSTGKFAFGDGNVASATIASGTYNSGSYSLSSNSSGSFVAESGCTLVITASKGISGATDGNIRTASRTFGTGINYIFAKNDGFNPISIGTSFFNGEINAVTGIKNMTIDCPYGVYFASTYTGAGNNNTSGFVTTLTYTGGNDITVNGVLNFVSGKLYTGDYVTVTTNSVPAVVVNLVSYYPVVSLAITPGNTSTLKLNVGTLGSITGAGTGWVVGNLKKATAAGSSPSFTYAIGNATNYSPLALTFSGNTSAAGSLTASTASGEHASIATSGIDATKSLNRTWTLTNDALAGFGTYDAAFGYASTDNDVIATPASYLARLYSGTAWSAVATSGTITNIAATATGISAFGDFAFGEASPLVAPEVVATVNVCLKSAAALTATAYPGNTLRWYADNTTTKFTTSAPVLVTTAVGTKTFYVAQVSGTNVSTRALITVNVLALPDNVATLITSDAVLCRFLGNTNQVVYTAGYAAGNGLSTTSYAWTIPAGVSIIGLDNGPTLTVDFHTATLGLGAASLGAITVKGVNANQCSSVAKSIALATKVPTAPTALVMTSTDSTPSFKGITTAATESTPAVYGLVGLNTLTAGIKKVGPYMGTETVFTLTAAAAVTAASYLWTLPTGVNAIASGTVAISSLGVVTSTSSVITVNFAGVTPGTTALPIVVQSVGGCGNSTNRTLSLARSIPTAPTALTLTNATQANLSALPKITKVGPYTDTEISFTLTATPFTTQGAEATSYAWVLPEGVVCTTPGVTSTTVSGSTVIATVPTPWSYSALSSPTNSITVNFSTATGTGNLDLKVFGVNGAGNSIARTLVLARALPTAPSALVLKDGSTVVTKVGSYTTKETPLTLTATPFATQGAEATSFSWVLPAGVNVVSGATLVTDNGATKTYSGTATVLTVNLQGIGAGVLSIPLNVYAVNGAGTSATARTLTVTSTVAATPGSITTPTLAVPKFNPGCATGTITVQVPDVAGLTYAWTVAGIAGSTSRIVSGNGTHSIVIDVFGVETTTLSVSVVASNGTGPSAAKTLAIGKTTVCVTRIAPQADAEAFKVVAYPNPSSSEFTIEASRKGATTFEVYNMQGRLIENRKANSNTVQVGSRYAAGTYNVIVKQGENTKTLRVIKK